MTEDEVGELLKLIAGADHRTIGDADITMWLGCMYDVDYQDARAAVIHHFRTSTEWLKPAHVRETVRRMRADRIRVPVPDPPAEIDGDPVKYREHLQRQIAAMASRKTVRAALAPARPRGNGPTPEARAVLDQMLGIGDGDGGGPARAGRLTGPALAAAQAAEYRARHRGQGMPTAPPGNEPGSGGSGEQDASRRRGEAGGRQ